MTFSVGPKSKCPCGSGKFYKNCHNPKRDINNDNLWKGPGYDQIIYFGDKEKFNEIKYDTVAENEFILRNLSGDIIPIGRFIYIDNKVSNCSAVVSDLDILINNNSIAFSGSIRVEGNIKDVPIIIGTSNMSMVKEFSAKVSGIDIPFKRGNWRLFIGENENPISRAMKMAQWFRYFNSPGFLVKLKPSEGEFYFRVISRLNSSNAFSLSLPFDNIELSCPNVITEKEFISCFIEIERENISWDLVLSQDQFNGSSRKDTITYNSNNEKGNISFPFFENRIRKEFINPRKIYFNLFVPNKNPVLENLGKIIENSLKHIAENSGFNFDNEQKSILEADFRDYILGVLKSIGYVAIAEPLRKEGFVDILINHENTEYIIEFKVWGRRNYKKVINQALSYGTAWTNEYAIVMINPNKDSIIEKYMSNSKRSRGFEEFVFVDSEYKPVQKLISIHYIPNWQKRFNITHFIINTNFTKS